MIMKLINIFPLFFNIGSGELFIILIAVFLIFGPKRIPEIANKIGKAFYEMKKASNDVKKQIIEESKDVKEEINIDKNEITDQLPEEPNIEIKSKVIDFKNNFSKN